MGPALRAAHAAGRLDLPLPGSGRTRQRWTALAELSAADLSLGRLAEAHADALAILAELGGPPGVGLWGVWAAEPPAARVTATERAGRWTLDGRKAWCSGAEILDRALVSAHAADGRRLFAVPVPGLEVEKDSWSAVGMAATGTVTVRLDAVAAEPVGGPGAYLDRPGFWHGGAGVAACWYGGALGAARLLLAAARSRPLDPHALAHLGAVDALVAGLAAHLATAAAEIDADPAGPGARLRQARLRARVEAGATEILDRVGRALGPGPLATDPVQAQRAADLPVYLRQSHAERDLATLGELAAEGAAW
ncbi:MAG TPA: acyl-CoA dehydrogenase [Mycobacteriales bacterium]|nr:acyl-CoA dehydrogenase [Mycobacteriales bacterium]